MFDIDKLWERKDQLTDYALTAAANSPFDKGTLLDWLTEDQRKEWDEIERTLDEYYNS